MSIARSMRRKAARKSGERITCPKCHARLTDKFAYGRVCEECGWWRGRAEYNKRRDEELLKDDKQMRGGSDI